MATNNMKLIKEAIQETTETYVDQYMKNATFVKTEIGVVVGKGSHKGNKITIKQDKMGIQKNPIYDDIMSVGNIIFDDGCVVYVFIPNGQYNNMFILGQLDDTPANIKGGTIRIGTPNAKGEYPYTVLSDGSLKIGTPNANGEYPYNVSPDGGLDIGHGSYKVSPDGGLDIGYGKFTVSPTGSVHFSGEIKGARFVTEGSSAYTVIDKGTIQTYNTSGYKGIQLYGNTLTFYDYNNTGEKIGTISQTDLANHNIRKLSICSENNREVSIGYRKENGYGNSLINVNKNGSHKVWIGAPIGESTFVEGIPVTDTMAAGDGNHVIQAGWSGYQLFFYVDTINVTNNISDKRQKNDITKLNDKIINAVGSCEWKQFKLNRDKKIRANKQQQLPIGFGIIAQDLEQALKDQGVSEECILKMTPKIRMTNSDSTSYLGVDYTQFLIARVAYDEKLIKSQNDKITDLENRLISLEEKINNK